MSQGNRETVWICDVDEDPETGDLMIILPNELVEQLGWKNNDILSCNVDQNGDLSLKKD